MLDIALLSSNAAQLKYILTVSVQSRMCDSQLSLTIQVGEEHEYYLPMLALIISSIVLQVQNYNILRNQSN